MYILPRDSKILRSDEVFRLYAEYEKKFGESFVCFNYADFQGTQEKGAAQLYLETLREAVKANKPYRHESRRYEEFNH